MENITESLRLAWLHSGKVLVVNFNTKKWFLFGLLAWIAGITVSKQPVDNWLKIAVGKAASTFNGCLAVVMLLGVALFFALIAVYVSSLIEIFFFDSSLRKDIDWADLLIKYGDRAKSIILAKIVFGLAILGYLLFGSWIFRPFPGSILFYILISVPVVLVFFFVPFFQGLVMPSLLSQRMRGCSAIQASITLLSQTFNINTIVFYFVYFIILTFISIVSWGLSYPVFLMLDSLGRSNFFVAYGFFSLVTIVLTSMTLPFAVVFLVSFAMAYTSRAFPEYAVLTPVYDGQGNIIDSKNLYELMEEEKGMRPGPEVEPWQQMTQEQEKDNEANFETPFDKPLPRNYDTDYNGSGYSYFK